MTQAEGVKFQGKNSQTFKKSLFPQVPNMESKMSLLTSYLTYFHLSPYTGVYLVIMMLISGPYVIVKFNGGWIRINSDHSYDIFDALFVSLSPIRQKLSKASNQNCDLAYAS